MTQQPYYPQASQPQYPVAPAPPQVQYPQQPPAPAYPQQYGQPYPQQAYPAPAPQQPQVPLAQGNLDDYYAQPSAATGPSLSWQNKPLGTTYAGIVARDVTHADVQQQTDPSTGQPKFYRDGRPQFVMKVPLKLQPSPEFPEGEATWYVRGQSRDELVRAMSEVGCSGAPKGGAGIVVSLVQRRPSRMGNPANVVQVRYQPAPGEATQQPAAQQVQQPAAQAPTAPSPAVGQPFPPQASDQQQWQAPQVAPQGVQQYAQAPTQQFQQQAQPAAQPQPQGQGLPAPSDLSPEQQELLARLTGQQGAQAGVPAA